MRVLFRIPFIVMMTVYRNNTFVVYMYICIYMLIKSELKYG